MTRWSSGARVGLWGLYGEWRGISINFKGRGRKTVTVNALYGEMGDGDWKGRSQDVGLPALAGWGSSLAVGVHDGDEDGKWWSTG